MEFQSEFENDAKLKACALNDNDHIGEQFASKGPWVELIKKALNAWAVKQNPPAGQILINDQFGKETGDLVALYKTRQVPPILNYAGKIDRIVGKKTVVALDKELPSRKVAPAPLSMSALAQRDRLTSIQWALAAINRLTETRMFLATPPPGQLQGFPPLVPPNVGITLVALETHFHISTATITQIAFIDQVLDIYRKNLAILNNSNAFFIDDTTSAEAAKGTPAHVPFGLGRVNFTPAFTERSGTAGFGPNCRAAMVLHEPVHIADHPAASFVVNHVNENDQNYARQPAMKQLHNPHSYASFAQQVFFNGNDTRFGIGKPEL
ncbi:MAG: hypothetical protein HXX11_21135 [Desulfuromonadales bacterium]|nr:hypothetical protein [Desulfuromonadales bacterium]